MHRTSKIIQQCCKISDIFSLISLIFCLQKPCFCQDLLNSAKLVIRVCKSRISVWNEHDSRIKKKDCAGWKDLKCQWYIAWFQPEAKKKVRDICSERKRFNCIDLFMSSPPHCLSPSVRMGLVQRLCAAVDLSFPAWGKPRTKLCGCKNEANTNVPSSDPSWRRSC